MRGSGSSSDVLKKVQWPAAVAWAAVLCAVLFAQTYVRAQRPNGIDLRSYLLSADVLRHGGSPYVLPTPFPYLYPATLAFLVIPLTFVPATVAVIVWFALSVAAAVWSIRTVVLNARPDLEARSADLALLLAVFFTCFFTVAQSNLRNGQVNFIVLALCVAAALNADGGVDDSQKDREDAAAPAAMPSGPPLGISDSSRRGGRGPPRGNPVWGPWGPPPRAKKVAGLPSRAPALPVKLNPLGPLPLFLLRPGW